MESKDYIILYYTYFIIFNETKLSEHMLTTETRRHNNKWIQHRKGYKGNSNDNGKIIMVEEVEYGKKCRRKNDNNNCKKQELE